MEFTKLKIKAYKDKKMKQWIKDFDLPINPEQFTQSFKVKRGGKQAHGTQGNAPKYERTNSEELKLDFTFDGTGVVPLHKRPGEFHRDKPDEFQNDLIQQLDDFLSVVYSMNRGTHRPNFLRLIWGSFSFNTTGKKEAGFDCVLSDLQINYTLFAPDGKPLRAKLSATFLSFTELKRRLKKEGKGSPDLTHMRKVLEGDTLPLMTYRIYDDPTYYLQVAKANGLVNFRQLSPNRDLRFPPLEKTNP